MRKTLRVLFVGLVLAAGSFAEEHIPGVPGGGRPGTVPADQATRRFGQHVDACMNGRTAPPIGAVFESAADALAAETDSFKLLTNALGKCSSCHIVKLEGDSLQNARMFFMPGSVRGRPGEVRASRIIDALANIADMNNVPLSAGERGAIEEWSRVQGQ